MLFALPPIVDTADLPRATGTILHALAAGDLSPAEAADISKSVDAPVCAIEATDLHAWKRASSAWRPVPRIGRLSRLSREEIAARVGAGYPSVKRSLRGVQGLDGRDGPPDRAPPGLAVPAGPPHQ